MLFQGWHHLRSSEGCIISSQVFWIQTEACVDPSYHGMSIRDREGNRDIINVPAVPTKQKCFVQPKLKNNNVHLIRYNCAQCETAFRERNGLLCGRTLVRYAGANPLRAL